MDGEATVNPTGGTAPYTYEWNTAPPQLTQTATGLDGGTYTVVVTDDNGCTEESTVILTAPAVLSLSTAQVDVLCTGDLTGEATVTATGGTSPYSYSWNDPANQLLLRQPV